MQMFNDTPIEFSISITISALPVRIWPTEKDLRSEQQEIE